MRMALLELLRKAELERDADFLREGVRVLSQALLELEVTQHVGAERHERTPERTGQRNGYREWAWDTRVGTRGLRVPRVRDGSYFPSLLEPRKMITYLGQPGVPRTSNHAERANRRYRAVARGRYGWVTPTGQRAMLTALQGFDSS